MNSNSPTGYEETWQHVWLDFVKQYVAETVTDAYGNCYGIINPGKDFKVVIEGYADEISWAVNYITPEGYIYVKPNGGSDYEIASGRQ